MRIFTPKFSLLGLLILVISSRLFAQADTRIMDHWAFSALHIPELNSDHISKNDPLLIAIIDDAFNLNHQSIKEFIYHNVLEDRDNYLDDDGNGYMDDYSGWDLSDMDNDVSVPPGREEVFYHGTYIASIVAEVAHKAYGDPASEYIKIMPVKVLPDEVQRTYLKDGYEGIRYAMKSGADIICCAWSGGTPGPEEQQIVKEAREQGCLLVAAVGNFNTEAVYYPAALSEFIAVAGLDSLGRKEVNSNFGKEVDISAPADKIPGAHPLSENAYFKDSGTSAATALFAGSAAVLMLESAIRDPDLIKELLLNSSDPFPAHFGTYGGKMGAGKINLTNALRSVQNPLDNNIFFSPLRSKGSIIAGKQSVKYYWRVAPAGAFHGFSVIPDLAFLKKPGKMKLEFYSGDTIWNKYSLANLPPKIYIPGNDFELIVRDPKFRKKQVLRLSYEGNPIDSSTLFCSGLRYLSREEGFVEDGSGESNYAANSSCRWLISVPEGKKISFEFQEMNTEANVDNLYLFEGDGALTENMLARFSGENLPPVLTSQSNQVLVWFVSDGKKQGRGWKFKYTAVEKASFSLPQSSIWDELENTTWYLSEDFPQETYTFYTDNSGRRRCIFQVHGSGVYVIGRDYVEINFPFINSIEIDGRLYRLEDDMLLGEKNALKLFQRKALVYNRLEMLDMELVKSARFDVKDIDKSYDE